QRQSRRGGQVGAVAFIQFFGSAMQVTPHFHSRVPDGVFAPGAKRPSPSTGLLFALCVCPLRWGGRVRCRRDLR
ncbi:transposase, partial [Corallococcus llansteffanensis]